MLHSRTTERTIASEGIEPDKLARLLADDVAEFKKTILRLTQELVGSCKYCVVISSDPNEDKPVTCIKYANLAQPRQVNADICLPCGEYKHSSISR